VLAGAGDTRPLYEVLAERANTWNRNGNVGIVAGVTYPKDVARLRRLCPWLPFLLPGLGAQGGEAAAAVRGASDAAGGGFLINASRQVLYASRGPDFAEAAHTVATQLRDEINQHREAVGSRQSGGPAWS